MHSKKRRHQRSQNGDSSTQALIRLASVQVQPSGIQSTAGVIDSWDNSGTLGSAGNLDVRLGTAANMKPHPTGSMLLYGASGDLASTPSTPANTVTGSHIAGGYIQFDDYTPSSFEGIIRKHESAGNQRGFELNIAATTGLYALSLSSAGSNNESVASTEAPGISDGTGFWAFYVYNSSVPNVTFYKSLASPSASLSDMFDVKSQVGDVVSVTAASIFATTADVKVGTASNGAEFKAFLISGTDINGTLVVDFNASDGGNKTGVAGDTFVSGGVTWTMAGNTFIQNTGQTVVNSIGSAGLETTAEQLITGKTTEFLVAKFNDVAASSRLVSGHSNDAQRHALFKSGTTWTMFAGSALSFGTVDDGLHLWTAQYNEDTTSKLTISGEGSTVGDAGNLPMGALTLFASTSGASTSQAFIAEYIIFDFALTTQQVAYMQRYFSQKYGIPE